MFRIVYRHVLGSNPNRLYQSARAFCAMTHIVCLRYQRLFFDMLEENYRPSLYSQFYRTK